MLRFLAQGSHGIAFRRLVYNFYREKFIGIAWLIERWQIVTWGNWVTRMNGCRNLRSSIKLTNRKFVVDSLVCASWVHNILTGADLGGSGTGVDRTPLNFGVYPVTDFILVGALVMDHARKNIVRRVNARWKLHNVLNLFLFVFIIETVAVLDAVWFWIHPFWSTETGEYKLIL